MDEDLRDDLDEIVQSFFEALRLLYPGAEADVGDAENLVRQFRENAPLAPLKQDTYNALADLAESSIRAKNSYPVRSGR